MRQYKCKLSDNPREVFKKTEILNYNKITIFEVGTTIKYQGFDFFFFWNQSVSLKAGLMQMLYFNNLELISIFTEMLISDHNYSDSVWI
jgi:hypothetical protein